MISNKITRIPPKEVEAIEVELKVIAKLFNSAINSQNELIKTMKSIETEIAALEGSIEAKKHYFVGCQKVELENSCEDSKEVKRESQVGGVSNGKFDSEASLVNMLRQKMAHLKEVFGAKNRRLDECQTTVEYTQLREFEVTVEEKTSALEALIEKTKSQAEVARLGCKFGRTEVVETANESSTSERLGLSAKMEVEEETTFKSPVETLTANQLQFLRNHLQIEAVRKRNAYLITYLQTITAENQHFGELRKSVRTELAAQNRTIGVLQNELKDRKETFDFSQSKMTSSSYLGFQKAYSKQFKFVDQRKVGRKDGSGRQVKTTQQRGL